MKRTLVYILIVIVLAGWLGTLIARDPGYVLVSYGGYSLQTSLWVLLGIFAGIVILAAALLRLLRLFFRMPRIIGNWKSGHSLETSRTLTAKGLALFFEGEFDRAKRYLDAGAQDSLTKGINYLLAAWAADDAGDVAAREDCLGMSEETDASLAPARRVTSAALALRRGDHRECLNTLAGLGNNALVLPMRQAALRHLGDHRGMLELVPDLAERSSEQAHHYEIEAALLGFRAIKGDPALDHLYRSLSPAARKDPAVLLAYTEALDDASRVEPLLRAAIKKNWVESLVVAYGELPENTLKVRTRNLLAWKKHHDNSAALHYCLGLIHESSNHADLARVAYTRSIDIGGVGQARLRLAALHEKAGDLRGSIEQLRAALE